MDQSGSTVRSEWDRNITIRNKTAYFHQCLESQGSVKVNVSFISDKFEKVGGEQATPLFLGNQDNKEEE